MYIFEVGVELVGEDRGRPKDTLSALGLDTVYFRRPLDALVQPLFIYVHIIIFQLPDTLPRNLMSIFIQISSLARLQSSRPDNSLSY
jgi:hypothetical protein